MFNKHTGNGSFSKRRGVLSLEDTHVRKGAFFYAK